MGQWKRRDEKSWETKTVIAGWVSCVDLVSFHYSKLQKFCCQGLHYLYFYFPQLPCLCTESRFLFYALDTLSKKERH